MRRATHDDMARIWEIRHAVRENRLSDPARVTDDDVRWFLDNAPFHVADAAGEVVAFCAGDPRDGSIWALFVDPVHEGRGHGTILLETVCAELRQAGHRRAWLTTGQGTRAEGFYRNRGWFEAGVQDNGELRFERGL